MGRRWRSGRSWERACGAPGRRWCPGSRTHGGLRRGGLGRIQARQQDGVGEEQQKGRARRQRGPRRRPHSWSRVLLDHADRILAAVREAESALAAVKGTVGAITTLATLPSTVAQIVAPALFSPCPAAPRVLPPAPPSLPALLLVEMEVVAGPGRWGALPSHRGNRLRSGLQEHVNRPRPQGSSRAVCPDHWNYGATELRSCGVTASRSAVCGPPSSSRRRTPRPRRTVRRVRRPARSPSVRGGRLR